MIHFQSAHQLIFAFGIYRISLIKLWLHECSLLAGCNLVFVVWINVYGILFVFIPNVSLFEESVCVASNDKMMVKELLLENSDALFELLELLFVLCFFWTQVNANENYLITKNDSCFFVGFNLFTLLLSQFTDYFHFLKRPNRIPYIWVISDCNDRLIFLASDDNKLT